MREPSQCDRVLDALSSGKWVSVPAIHRKAGTMRLNSRISELRSRGHEIQCEHRKGRGARSFFYRWTNIPADYRRREDSPTMPDPGIPSTPATAYRIYTFNGTRGHDLRCVAAAASPEALGVALVTMGAEGEFDDVIVGVMYRPDEKPGRWLLSPWCPE